MRVVLGVFAVMLLVGGGSYEVDEPSFTPIQHATFVIEADDVTIFVDPVGSADVFGAFPSPDIILITDIHGDHLSADVVKAVRADKTSVIGPKAVTDQLDSAVTLSNGDTTTVSDVMIEAIPMYNLTEGRLQYHEKGRGNGYVLTVNDIRIYISGDTEDIPEMRSLEDIDYAFVCMNLPYTMTVDQAASAVLEFEPAVVYPYHYRGQDGMSDTARFKTLVSVNENIEVRQLDWYGSDE